MTVNFLFPWEVACAGMSVRVGGGEGIQRFFFRCVSGGLLGFSRPELQGEPSPVLLYEVEVGWGAG